MSAVLWRLSHLLLRGLGAGSLKYPVRISRKREDKAFFENYTRWPGSYCCVKEQPWLPGQTRRFGTVYLDEFQAGNFTVHVEGASTERFASLEALVEIWSVD